MLQYGSVFRNQGRFGKEDRREHGTPMRCVGVGWKMQSEGGIQQTMAMLHIGSELEFAPAINTVARLFKIERRRAAINHHAAQGILEMACIESPKAVGAISETRSLGIGEQHEAGCLDAADSENEHLRSDRASLARSIRDED